MNRQIEKRIRLLIVVIALMAIPASMFAQSTESGQLQAKKKMAGGLATNSSARAKSRAAASAQPTGATTYNYTLVAFPGTLNTLGVGMNPGALHGRGEKLGIQIVGAEVFPDGSSQTGFLAQIISNPNSTIESYQLINDPQAPTPQQAYSVNDYGEVVGDYFDSSTGIFHSWRMAGGQFIPLDVPFNGATGTYSPAINNAGEIVGGWYDSGGIPHSYTMIGGKFTSFDCPAGSQAQFYYGINSAGDITGSYSDSNGNTHGFLKKGASCTSIDFPGAVYTATSGINDSGVVVGGYCLTTECTTTGAGELGFLWSGGVYTTLNFPAEYEVGLATINDQGVIMGNYVDATELVYTFVGTPQQE